MIAATVCGEPGSGSGGRKSTALGVNLPSRVNRDQRAHRGLAAIQQRDLMRGGVNDEERPSNGAGECGGGKIGDKGGAVAVE